MRVILIIFAAIIAAFVFIAVHALLKLCRRPIEQLYAERAGQDDFCPLDEIPERMTQLILQHEDLHFFEHHGIDPECIKEALRLNLRERRIAAGASTITQQLIKNLYFHFRQTILRKIEELILVPFVEHRLGKRKILELYMNIIYYGYGVYGIVEAARFYFNRELAELTLNQMFILAFIPQAPTRGDPIRHPEGFVRRRDKKLDFMIRHEQISAEEAEAIRAHRADCIDEQLHANDSFTSGYPLDIVMINERFGPFGSKA